MRRTLSIIAACVPLACAAPAAAPASPPAASNARTPAPARPPATSGGPAEERELARYFDEARVTGTVALLDSASSELVCSQLAKCRTGYLPASTFKIPNTIVALESGVALDPETPLPWDGKQYSVPAWNQDHTLRSALQVSCVPCFQALARAVGQQRMDDWLRRLNYGNVDTSGGIDRFWLTGGLRTSPLEQVDFLRRLERGELPIQERTREYVLDMMTLDVGPSHVLRGKTGLTMRPEAPHDAGWFVGWVERDARRIYFALLIDGAEAGVDVMALRRPLTERILRERGLLPA